MTDPDPYDVPPITVPASATRAAETARPADPVPATGASNGAQATVPALRPDPDEPRPPEPVRLGSSAARPAEERALPPTPARPAVPGRGVAVAGSRFVIIHPHVSFFSWLADLQGPVDAPPQERLDRYRSRSPGLFRICVVLDLLVLFVVSGILVAALAAVLFKAIWGVV
jgi:hypothetical protein